MKLRNVLTIMALIIFAGSGSVLAQISAGGTPPSFDKSVRQVVDMHETGTVDRRALLEEDANTPKDVPFRFGYPFDVKLDINSSGTWETLADGSRLWRLKISSPDAYSINLIFDRFWLPDGARFFIYNESRTHLIGSFTSQNNKDYGKFATEPVPGDVSVLEYWEPAGVNANVELRVSRIVHAYRNLFNWDTIKDVLDYGDAGACNNNVRCPEFEEFDQLIRSVAMITTSGGFRLCTGAMVNNVREDLTPYFLTANHCLGGENTWVFIWNYESPNCNNIDGPTWMSVSGSTLRANNSFSDFALLELSSQPPDSFGVFYAGWNAVDDPSDSVIAVHHPSGDIKKISFDYDAVTATSYLGSSIPGDNSHWRVGQWEDGTTEPGSSGSPIFNRQGQIIGQLHGGYASCASITSDWYGKVSQSWSYGGSASTRLSDWLDPDNTGLLELGGRESAGISITHEALPDTRDTLNDYEVLATITSDTNLVADSLLLYYEVNTVTYEDTMTSVGGDDFAGYIPAQQPGTEISYYLLAVDEEGKADTTDTFVFSVIDYGLSLAPAADTLTGPVDDTVWYDLTVTNTGVYADDYALSVSGNTWQTDLYDAGGTTPISSSGSLFGDESFDFKVRVIVPVSVYGDNDLVTVTATSTGDPSFTESSQLLTVSDGQPLLIPFEDDFPSTTVDIGKWVETGGAEVNESGINEPSTPYSLNLNGSPTGGDTVMSQVIDLGGENNVVVSYSYQRTGGGDSPESGDDLFIEYKDSSGNWQVLQQHLGSGDDMTTFTEVLTTVPGNGYHPGFRLRVRSVGTAGNFDDWFVDDIFVGLPQDYDVELNPGLASSFGAAGDTVSYSLWIINKGAQDDTYALNAANNAWDVSFWDAAATGIDTSTGVVPSGDSVQMLARVEVPSGSVMNDLDTADILVVSLADAAVTDDGSLITYSSGPPGGFPWLETFPTDTLVTLRWQYNAGAVVSTEGLNPPSMPYSLQLDGGIDTVVSLPIDLSSQSDVIFSYYIKQGGVESPDDGDDFWVEYMNSSSQWVTLNQHLGADVAQPSFEQVVLGLPVDAYHANFQFRMRSTGSCDDCDHWYVDDIAVDNAPSLTIAPASFDMELEQGDSTNADLVLENSGLGTLYYNLSMIPVTAKSSSVLGDLFASGELEPASREYPEGFEDYENPKGFEDAREGFPVEKDAGGPDAAGYFWIDSDEPGGPQFDWIDVSATGTDIIADLGDDNFGGPYDIGFDFPYYDDVFTRIYVGSNGLVGFFPTDMQSRFRVPIPNDSTPNGILAWCWDDLNPTDSDNPNGHVYIDTTGGRCVIQFVDYSEYGGAAGDVITAQIILEADGTITYQYLDIASGFDISSSAIGIESPDGTDGLEVAYLTAYLKDSLAVQFTRPYQWVTMEAYSGSIAPGESDTVQMLFRTAEIDSGYYEANITVNSNDPDNTPLTIPAALTVTIEPQWICGDVNGDDAGPIVSDLTYLVDYLFRGGPEPPIPAAADMNGDGSIVVSDLTMLVDYLFRGGPPPTCGL